MHVASAWQLLPAPSPMHSLSGSHALVPPVPPEPTPVWPLAQSHVYEPAVFVHPLELGTEEHVSVVAVHSSTSVLHVASVQKLPQPHTELGGVPLQVPPLVHGALPVQSFAMQVMPPSLVL